MLRIGIYPRKSVYRDNSDSVQVQITACKDYARLMFKDQELDFRIYDKDEGFSGKNTHRPSFTELMADVKADELDIIIVYKLDRISRSVKDFSEIYETLQQHNVSFLSVKESFDTSTPMGRTVMYILSAFAQLERENTAERVADNMASLGEAGKWTGGTLPPGMTSVRKKIGDKTHSYLIVDEQRIKTVKYIFSLMLSGTSITKLERTLRTEGIRTERDAFYSCSKLYNLFTNPVYCANDMDAYYYFLEKGYKLPDPALFDGRHGLIGYGRTTQSNGTTVRKDTYSIAIGIHDPVLSGADWIAIQKRLGQNKSTRYAKYEAGILKGILRCKCGVKMNIRTYKKNGSLFSYYYCPKMAREGVSACDTGYTRVDDIDDRFLQELKKIKLSPDSIELEENVSYVDTGKMRADLKKTTDSIRNLMNALSGSADSAAAKYIIAELEALDKEKSVLEKKLRTAEQRNRRAAVSAETKEFVYHRICNLLDNIDSMSYTEINELIRSIVKSCVFDGDHLDVTF